MRMLIVDDHPLFRRGVRDLVGEAFDPVSFGEAEDAAEAAQALRAEKWDIVLLDITMPGRDGLEVLRDLKHAHPKLPVLVVSMHPEDQFGVRVLKAGGSGYLTKDKAPQVLVEAIETVRSGRKYMSPELVQQLARDVDAGGGGPRHEALSDREYEVVRMIASGRTVGDIAKELKLSVKTVSTYRSRALDKMGMNNNAELTAYALREGLVD